MKRLDLHALLILESIVIQAPVFQKWQQSGLVTEPNWKALHLPQYAWRSNTVGPILIYKCTRSEMQRVN